MKDENLWGDLPLDVQLETPLSILKRQGSVLTKETKGLLEGRVVPMDETEWLGEIVHELRIIAPAMGNFSTPIATIGHGIVLYPVKVYNDLVGEVVGEAKDELILKELLKRIFQSEKAKSVIRALIAQSKAGG